MHDVFSVRLVRGTTHVVQQLLLLAVAVQWREKVFLRWGATTYYVVGPVPVPWLELDLINDNTLRV